ncbi:MAG TPA: hypothetical protein VNZ86_17320, partial [Bacteroidia bacterium]|nr:hypothetical protein [Bacteroidia bacterium]
KELGLLFSLDQHTVASSFEEEATLLFRSREYVLPPAPEPFPDLCILTRINVFGNIWIESSASLISNPYCVNSLYNLAHGRSVRLTCLFTGFPKWECT